MQIATTILDTPLGKMNAATTDKGICLLEFDNPERLKRHLKAFEEFEISENNSHPKLLQLQKELEEYFNKSRRDFDISLDIIGSDFQHKVWQELISIPYGTTRSYLEQSKAIGNINAIRAVANANGQNRISIVIPCHRVIGSNGDLTGYGGKIWRKKYLLELESNQTSLFSEE